MMQRTVVLASVAVWLGLGCGVEGGGPAAFQRQAITDGVEDTGHPEVGRLLIDARSGTAQDTCTAVLIGKQVALTAAHCCKPQVNNLFQLDKKLYQVSRVVPHGSWDPSVSKYKNDICVVLLQDPVTLSTFPPYGTVIPTDGMAVTLVGMGRTSESVKDSGTKRKASNTVDSVGTGYFAVAGTGGGEGNICSGDSGGPVYTGSPETVLGVISAELSPYCVGSQSFHVTIQTFSGWIASQIASANDTVPPQVAITAPADGSTVSPSVLLKVDATDNVGVAAVGVLVDGSSAGTLTPAPYELLLTLSPGSHTIEAVATDLAGNTGADQVTVTVTVGPPPDGGTTEAGVTPAGDGHSPPRPTDCSVGGSGSGTWPLLGLILVIALGRRRRRWTWRHLLR